MALTGDVEIVDDVARAFADLVARESPASIALSGGSTAERCYTALAGTGPDWSGVDVFFGDERCVPVTDPDSNEGMARRALLYALEPRAIHSMATAGPDPEAAAAAYGRLLADRGPVDLVHLGLGPDGHTASLFPGGAALAEREHRVVVAADALHPHRRLTVTLPWLATAHLVVFTVAGAEKRDALARVAAGDDLPAARVRAARVVWLVDREAAGTGPA